MNTELLLKVKAAILKEPRKFDMRKWFGKDDNSPCGTTACIAGHALAIGSKYKSLKPGLRIGKKDYLWDTPTVAMRASGMLSLDRKEWFRLFYMSRWPRPFFSLYSTASTARQRARIAAKRIDHFIKTEGRE